MKRYLIFLLSLLVLCFTVRPVYASGNGTVEVVPAYTDVTIDASQSAKQIKFSYTNHSSTPITLDLFPIDFKQQNNGSLSFLGQSSGAYSYSLSSFLSFDTNRLYVPAGETRQLIVTIKNREDISPGGHYAAVVARMVSNTNHDGKTSVLPSVSSLILMKKTGGEHYDLSLLRTDWPDHLVEFGIPQSIDLLFQNDGNVHLIPYGQVVVKDVFGRVVAQGIINDSSLIIFPEVQREINADFTVRRTQFPVSFDTMTITGQDSIQKVQYHYVNSFIYINPYFAICLFLLIVFLFHFWRVRRKKKRVDFV